MINPNQINLKKLESFWKFMGNGRFQDKQSIKLCLKDVKQVLADKLNELEKKSFIIDNYAVIINSKNEPERVRAVKLSEINQIFMEGK